MLRLPRRLVALAVAVTAVLGACGSSTDDPPTAGSTTTLPVVSEVGQRRTWDGMILPPDVGPRYEGAATRAALVELAELGAPNVAVVVPLVQDDAAAVPHQDPSTTPTDAAISDLMATAVDLELGVVVQLRVEVAADPSAAPDPADPARWFADYGRLAVHYAQVAERHEASLFVLGAVAGDLVDADDAWTQVVDDVRAVYDGPLAFAVDAVDLERVSLWDTVDVIGIDITFPPEADVPEPVAADLEKAWEPVLAQLTSLAETWSRPVVFTRVGFPGVERTTTDPPEVGVDHQLSAYEALFTVTNQTPAIDGVLVWRWGSDPASASDGDASYSPEGRPAEEVLRRAWTTPLADDDTEAEGTEGAGSGDG